MSDITALTTEKDGSQPPGTVELTVRHQGVETKIIGTPDGVVRELLAYFSKILPSIELASKLVLSVDNSEFLQSCAGILATTSEGLAVLKNVESLRDKELLLLHLTGARLEHTLGKRETDSMTLDEVTKATGRSTGSVAGRFSELHAEQLAERVGKGSYRLTTMGTRTVIKSLMPKLASLPNR
jgi:hypothetical protein